MTKTVVLRNFDFVSNTDKGLERAKNEDYLAYFDTLNGHVFIVCDGMGGHTSGEVASEKAVEAVGEFFNSRYFKNPFLAVENAIHFANKKVYNISKNNPEYYNMGTTLVLVLIRDNRAFYGHVGDSRLYAFRKNQLIQLTRDHSYVNKLVDEKIITEKEALTHPAKNEITRAIGLIDQIEPEVANSAYIPQEGDILLLCSDGLNNMLSHKELEKILSLNQPIRNKSDLLIEAANSKGGEDNITLQLIRFHNIDRQKDMQKGKSKFIKNKKIINTRNGMLVFLFLFFLLFFLLLSDNKEDNKTIGENNSLLISKKYMPGKSGRIIIYPYQLNENENFEDIANRFNVDVNYLSLLNPNITNEIKGKHLKIPIQDIYTVHYSEDIELICRKYNINMISLMKANNIYSKNIPIGIELIIPLSGNHYKKQKLQKIKEN